MLSIQVQLYTADYEETEDREAAAQGTELANGIISLKRGPRTQNTRSRSSRAHTWPSVGIIPVRRWTSPPRRKESCCLPQSSSPRRRGDSGHSGSPKHSTSGRRRATKNLKETVTVPRVSAVSSTLEDSSKTDISWCC